jgi:predicted nuclease with TOPRIM domain
MSETDLRQENERLVTELDFMRMELHEQTQETARFRNDYEEVRSKIDDLKDTLRLVLDILNREPRRRIHYWTGRDWANRDAKPTAPPKLPK